MTPENAPVYVVMAWGDNYPEEPIAVYATREKAIRFVDECAVAAAAEENMEFDEFWSEQNGKQVAGWYLDGSSTTGYSIHELRLNP